MEPQAVFRDVWTSERDLVVVGWMGSMSDTSQDEDGVEDGEIRSALDSTLLRIVELELDQVERRERLEHQRRDGTGGM